MRESDRKLEELVIPIQVPSPESLMDIVNKGIERKELSSNINRYFNFLMIFIY